MQGTFHTETIKIKLTSYNESKKRAHDSQILSWDTVGLANDKHQVATNGLKLYWVWGLTRRPANKDEAIAIKCDWVYNLACRLLHDIHIVSYLFQSFKLVTKIRIKTISLIV